jgi:outer membrane receptor protein involved in Fe transport
MVAPRRRTYTVPGIRPPRSPINLLTLLLALSVADAPPPPETPVSETIIVTATRGERTVSDLPVSATVIREEEIEAAPVRSVDDLLRTVPGVTPSIVSSSGSTPNNQRFSMHGLGGTRALVLLDGIPLHDPYSGIVQWQNVPLQSLRQIEVVRGGNASVFGNFALGGTVNLITRPIEANSARVDLSYGSGNSGRAALTLDYVVSPLLSLRVSHHQRNADGFVRVPDPGPIDIDAWVDNVITTARADFHLAEGTRAFVNASTSEIDISQGTPSTFSKRDINAFSGGVHHAVGAGGLFSFNAYTQRQREHLRNSSIIGRRESEFVTQDGRIPSTGSGASLEWTMQRNGAIPVLSVGVDLQQLEASEDRISFNRAGAVTQRERVGGRQRFAAVFAQASWRPSQRLEILGSARADRFSSDKGASVIAGGASTAYPATSSTQVDPRLSVRYGLGGRSAIRGSVYRAFNAPALRDLYRNTQSGNSTLLNNPFLEPETLVGGEVGWEWANGSSRVEVNVYRSTIDGMQARVTVGGNPNILRIMNLGTGRSQGVEAAGDLRLSRRWAVNAGYTYAHSVVVSDPDPALIGNWLGEVPRHAGSLALRFRGDGGTTGELRGRVVGRSYGDATNLALAPAHRIVDFSLSQPVRPWMDAYVLVENAFDETYYLALAVNSFRSGLPRTVTVGVRLDGLLGKGKR